MQHKCNMTVIKKNVFTAVRRSGKLHLKYFFLVCDVDLLNFNAELFLMEMSL